MLKLFTIVSCFFCLTALGQNRNEIKINIPESEEIDVNELGKANLQIEVSVEIPKNKDSIVRDIQLKITCDKTKGDNRMVTILTTFISISTEDLKVKDSTSLKRYIYATINADSTLKINNNRLIFIKIESVNSDSMVKFSNNVYLGKLKSSYTIGNNKINISLSLGTNLDFADGLKANSFYSRLSYYNPHLYEYIDSNKLDNKSSEGLKWSSFFGVYGGIYQNRSVSPKDFADPLSIFYNPIEFINGDSIKINKIFAKRKQSIANNNYGLFFSLLLNLLSRETMHSKTFISINPIDLQAVLRRQITNYTYLDSLGVIDTVPRITINDNNRYSEGIEENHFDKYLGLAPFSLSFKNDDFTIYFRVTLFGKHYLDDIARPTNFYHYYLSFRENKFGVRIGAELLGDWNGPTQATPSLNIFVTKQFDLDVLANQTKNYIQSILKGRE